MAFCAFLLVYNGGMEVASKERPTRSVKTKQLSITSSFSYEAYEVGTVVECKFEVTKDGK